MAKHLLILLFLLSLHATCQAQDYLLFHKNRIREAHYYAGEMISIRILDNDFKVTDQIKGFSNGLILFDGYEVNPADITHLYVDRKTRAWFAFRYKFEKLFLFAGAGYLVLDVINTREVDKGTVLLGGSLIGAGLLAKVLISDRFKIKGKKSITIVGETSLQQ